jgi:histone acetyltransferase
MEESFIEIVFCTVDSQHQGGGYGRLAMNYLRTVIQYSELYDLLTCADNEAVMYFKKQGFNDKAIMMDPRRCVGRIKDYDKITQVHCHIYPEVDSLNFPTALDRQLEFLEDRIGKRIHRPPFDLADRWLPFAEAPSFLNRSLPQVIQETDCGELYPEE